MSSSTPSTCHVEMVGHVRNGEPATHELKAEMIIITATIITITIITTIIIILKKSIHHNKSNKQTSFDRRASARAVS